MKKKCLLIKLNKTYLFIWNNAISGILCCCVSAKDMPQIFNSLLQVQKTSRNILKGAPSAPLYLPLFIYFCFSPNATEHYISICLKNWHDTERDRECKGIWLLEMDLFEARGNWTLLRVFLLAFYAALPEDLIQRIIKFKELRSYIRHHLLVDDESIGSLVPNQVCNLSLLPLTSASAEREDLWRLEYRYSLMQWLYMTVKTHLGIYLLLLDNYFW